MSGDRFLVTGAYGCVGAWVVKRLVEAGVAVWAFDLSSNASRLHLVMPDPSLKMAVNVVRGDIAEQDSLDRVVADNGITHIVHLAALQIPLVRADPPLGARVNVMGTAAVLETWRRHASQLRGMSYASSVSVYGPPELYPSGAPGPDARLRPDTLYGVHKLASEEMARVYWQDYGLASVGLRPYIIYGPGRDQGLTSAPTKAMLAAALGKDFRIGYGGRYVYQYADDVARAFIQAARTVPDRAGVFDLGGSCVEMDEVIRAIEGAAPAAKGRITFEGNSLPFPSEVDDRPFQTSVGAFQWTSLEDGVKETVSLLREGAQGGRISWDA